ncbi:MAG: 3-hydroxyanthranilate 3,4-dioxygenase [Candidatus Heimdallarchaeota archaeon]|nr:3-hydroxyanthranilate 3,4-dioxygenase [Candidatus Heimdallarchaeota archaeon]
MPVNPVFNMKAWFEENEDKLKPPVGNQLVYEDNDWIVMAVGGPNSRKDYHFHYRGPEFFFMVKGDMMLKMKREDDNGNLTDDDVVIKEGEIFLMPREVIHSPQRPSGSWGLVLEAKALRGEKDHLRWYCENNECGNKLADFEFDLNNIVTELPPLMKKFFDSKEMRTCEKCGTYLTDAKPFEMPA